MGEANPKSACLEQELLEPSADKRLVTNCWRLSVSHPGGCHLRGRLTSVVLPVGASPGSHCEGLRKTLLLTPLGSGRQNRRGIVVKPAQTLLQGRDLVRASGTFHLGEMDSSHKSLLNFTVSHPEGKRKHRQEGSEFQRNRLRIYSSQGRGWGAGIGVPNGSDPWEGHRPTKTLRFNPRITEWPSHPHSPPPPWQEQWMPGQSCRIHCLRRSLEKPKVKTVNSYSHGRYGSVSIITLNTNGVNITVKRQIVRLDGKSTLNSRLSARNLP